MRLMVGQKNEAVGKALARQGTQAVANGGGVPGERLLPTYLGIDFDLRLLLDSKVSAILSNLTRNL
jgi:hypothetical protein